MNDWPTVNPMSPFPNYCDGYGNPGVAGLGYVSTMKIATGLADTSKYQGDLTLSNNIVSYDKAEKNGAYIGQINMGDASSFCGPMGRLWGYDLAVAPGLKDTLLTTAEQWDGSPLPVYSADPLLAATQELFGTDSLRRFPPAPGAYVLCANKSAMSSQTDGDPDCCIEPVNAVWSYLAVSITRDRSNSADLFVEDAGTYPEADEATVQAKLRNHVDGVVASIVMCGADQHVLYDETFISWTYAMVPSGYAATALTCAPYVALAKNAAPDGFDSLLGMSLSDWSAQAGPGVGPSVGPG